MYLYLLNALCCPKIDCSVDNRIMHIESSEVVGGSVDYDEDAILHILSRLDYPGLLQAQQELGWTDIDLPPTLPEDTTPAFLTALHTLLLGRDIVTGAITCPVCSRRYPVEHGRAVIKQEGDI